MIAISLQKDIPTADGNRRLDINIQHKNRSNISLYGNSGTGKTTILRMLAGLEPAREGKVVIDGTTWYDSAQGIDLKPQQRSVGLMFQDYALFPNMSVRENLRYALKKDQDAAIIDELLSLIELSDLSDRKPESLSGGQRQRVALARCLVNQPRLVLLDEPLAALDHGMRLKLQAYIKKAQERFKFNLIIVTHNIGEIIKLSSQLYTLNDQGFSGPHEPTHYFTGSKLSGKFQIEAELIAIKKEGILVVLSLLAGTKVIKIIVSPEEAENLKIGNQVLVASKGFNPMIYRVG